MDKTKLIFIGVLTLVAVILCLVLWILAIVGGMDLTDGCLYRYNLNSDSSISSSDHLTNTVILKANGNYTADQSAPVATLDPTTYGKWLNTNLRLDVGQKVNFAIKGDVSLCKAYVPNYNLQGFSNLDISGNLIEIPRIEDRVAAPASLIFDAKTDEWRNLTQVFRNDHIIVSLQRDKKTTSASTSVYNSVQKGNISADCREGSRAYSPMCGRYTVWNAANPYVDRCEYNAQCYQCNCHDVCSLFDIFGFCIGTTSTVCDWCSCYQNVYGIAPEPYRNDGKYTFPWSNDINSLFLNFDLDCGSQEAYIDGYYQQQKRFWFSADSATGLLYRFDSNLDPSNKKIRGNSYSFAAIQSDQSYLNDVGSEQIILDTIYTASDVGYLQYRFHDYDGAFTDNTGGYVLDIKHTKCRRTNGNGFNDTVQGRGVVQYVIADYGKNPNNDMTGLTTDNIIVDANGSGSITAPSNGGGYLWLKIKNDPNDYNDSFGQYQVQFFTDIKKGGFYPDVLQPFFEGFKGKIKGAASTVFKNMTCYHGAGDTANCTNFFNYIKAFLTLYIAIFGMMFLLGMVKISQTDLVIRIVKIALVAGLINDSTFNFFNDYVFNFTTEFSDTIIANMSGYSLFSGNTTISNPMMFMNEVMTKIFLSSTFAAQIMALLSMGLNGAIYFILMVVCIGIVVTVLFRAIAIYLMAYMAITVLIGIAPLFLTFILFEKTRHLFDNWVKFTFRYMVEPVIMLAGVIILTQLFTIYLDYVIGYSVCWKCAIPFKIPFVNIAGISPAFLDIDLFCINWFAPWGFDHRSGQMGLNMQNMVVLLMIAYCLWGYIDFSSRIVGRIAGGAGGPSATGLGTSMAGKAEDSLLKKIGLDAASRAQIKQQATARLESMRKGNTAPFEPSNRHDVEPTTGASQSKEQQRQTGTSTSAPVSPVGSGASWKQPASSGQAQATSASSSAATTEVSRPFVGMEQLSTVDVKKNLADFFKEKNIDATNLKGFSEGEFARYVAFSSDENKFKKVDSVYETALGQILENKELKGSEADFVNKIESLFSGTQKEKISEINEKVLKELSVPRKPIEVKVESGTKPEEISAKPQQEEKKNGGAEKEGDVD